jgi:ferrochelatase
VSDHLEVLYDVDLEAQEAAREASVLLVRTESPNADPEFIDVLKGQVLAKAAERGL